jgi:hypothetical protein
MRQVFAVQHEQAQSKSKWKSGSMSKVSPIAPISISIAIPIFDEHGSSV